MKKFTSIIVLSFLISCSGIAQKSEKKIEKKYAIEKTTSEWKKQLNSLQYYILREAGTERPFTSPLNENKKVGIYVCAACETPLYDSSHKFDSGTGWPSFDRAIINNVELDVDYKIGYARTELKVRNIVVVIWDILLTMDLQIPLVKDIVLMGLL